MRMIFSVLSAAILGLLAGTAAAQGKANERENGPDRQTLRKLEEVWDFIGKKNPTFKRSASTTSCPMDNNTCTITVTIKATYDKANGGTALGCLAQVEDVGVDQSAHNITWSLVITDPTASYQFYPGSSQNPGEFAILKIEDDHNQLGNVTWNSQTMVSAPYRHDKKKDDRVVYYPLVVQNYNSVPVLCGSADPKIVNY